MAFLKWFKANYSLNDLKGWRRSDVSEIREDGQEIVGMIQVTAFIELKRYGKVQENGIIGWSTKGFITATSVKDAQESEETVFCVVKCNFKEKNKVNFCTFSNFQSCEVGHIPSTKMIESRKLFEDKLRKRMKNETVFNSKFGIFRKSISINSSINLVSKINNGLKITVFKTFTTECCCCPKNVIIIPLCKEENGNWINYDSIFIGESRFSDEIEIKCLKRSDNLKKLITISRP